MYCACSEFASYLISNLLYFIYLILIHKTKAESIMQFTIVYV